MISDLEKHLAPTDAVKAKFYALINARVNNRSRVEQAEKTNTILSQRIRRLTNAVQYADEETARELMEQAKELRKQFVPVPELREIPKEVCDAYLDGFRDLESKSYEEQKKTVRNLISKIVVNEDSLLLFTTKDRDVYCLVNKDGLQ